MDRAVSEAKFIIAQSYRKIAEQIETKIQRTNDKTVRSALIKQQAQTLERAGNLYELAIPGLETITSRTKLEETYLQLAYIHSADCLYDLGRYDKSIQGYERVIDRYEQNPIALSSYVQIINSYQKLGQSGKIKAVLERMKWLIKQLPDDTFTQNQGILSKSDWQNWIDWNYESGLITDDPPATLAQK
jgi:tetratricopeptide (TPR) repeat protein